MKMLSCKLGSYEQGKLRQLNRNLVMTLIQLWLQNVNTNSLNKDYNPNMSEYWAEPWKWNKLSYKLRRMVCLEVSTSSDRSGTGNWAKFTESITLYGINLIGDKEILSYCFRIADGLKRAGVLDPFIWNEWNDGHRRNDLPNYWILWRDSWETMWGIIHSWIIRSLLLISDNVVFKDQRKT